MFDNIKFAIRSAPRHKFLYDFLTTSFGVSQYFVLACGLTFNADIVIVELMLIDSPDTQLEYRFIYDWMYCRKINFASQKDSITKGVYLSDTPAIIAIRKCVLTLF